MPAAMHIVFVTREVWPFVTGGGIGRYVRDAAQVLARSARVTVLTSDLHREAYERLASAHEGWPHIPNVRFAWVQEPTGDLSPLWSEAHAWSLAAYRALRSLALEDRPDLVEFYDYGGVGAVAMDARRAGDAALRDVPLVTGLLTTWELTQVLDGLPHADLGARTRVALERSSLRFADVLLAPAAGTIAAYRGFYGPDELAPMRRLPHVFAVPAAVVDARIPPPADGPLRLLFVGRLERRKGVQELVPALRALDRADVHLTLLGGDTATGPGGGSMREYLEGLAAGDPRITFAGSVPPEAVAEVMREHHVVVVPSSFESFGYVAREACAENRPVLATPVGGLPDVVVDGRSGWLLADTSAESLAASIARLADRRDEVDALIVSGSPRLVVEEQSAALDPAAEYASVIEALQTRAPVRPVPEAPVSAVVTAVAGDGPLRETLAALGAQGVADLQVIVATDDPARVAVELDDALSALVFVAAGSSVTEARRAALRLVGADRSVLLLRAGEVLSPGFLGRCVAALATDPELAFVTTYTVGRHAACAPIGNFGGRLLGHSAAGIALFRAGELERGLPSPSRPGAEDAELHAMLAEDGRYGAVIPEQLAQRVHRERPHAVASPREPSRALWATAAG